MQLVVLQFQCSYPFFLKLRESLVNICHFPNIRFSLSVSNKHNDVFFYSKYVMAQHVITYKVTQIFTLWCLVGLFKALSYESGHVVWKQKPVVTDLCQFLWISGSNPTTVKDTMMKESHRWFKIHEPVMRRETNKFIDGFQLSK